jgi:hypothetical protein
MTAHGESFPFSTKTKRFRYTSPDRLRMSEQKILCRKAIESTKVFRIALDDIAGATFQPCHAFSEKIFNKG